MKEKLTEKKKTGPKGPLKPFNASLFENLCSIQATRDEIAKAFRIHPKTLAEYVKNHYNKPFVEAYEDFQADFKISLRRKVRELAFEENYWPAISKLMDMHLGTSEKVTVDVNVTHARLSEVHANPENDDSVREWVKNQVKNRTSQ